MPEKKLIGPFKQMVTMRNLPKAGPISDDQLEIITNGGIMIIGETIDRILTKDEFEKEVSHAKFHGSGTIFHKITENAVALPGLIDCHTHMCYAGTRAEDYARRLSGETYLQIAKAGGGMLDTVRKTRNATPKELFDSLFKRGLTHLHRGITTCEVKSGYGLTVEAELKMLEVINQAKHSRALLPDFIPTCLAAHTCPPEF
ncbi:MAG: imidazolonepropionase, partial [Promethearchaeota archaeon]